MLILIGQDLVNRSNKLQKYIMSLRKTKYFGELEEEVTLAIEDEMDALEDGNDDLMRVIDAQGDLGVGKLADKPLKELGRLLGIDTTGYKPFPFFETIVSDLGKDPGDDTIDRATYLDLLKRMPNADELSDDEAAEEFKKWDEELARHMYRRIWPRWHQVVGLVAMVERFFSHRNVLLADGVGVGKTMQAFMAMAFLRYSLRKQRKGENPLPLMSKWGLFLGSI